MVRNALAPAFAIALLSASCDLSYNNSCFTCDGTVPCPSGLSCIGGYCQTASGHCGSTTTGGGTTGGATTGGGTTTGSPLCTDPPDGLCPPGTSTNPGEYLSCEFGCCPSSEPFSCAFTALCYATPEQAAADCGDAGQGCSSCVSSWCGSPQDVGGCNAGEGYCGNGGCCPLSTPWYCNGQGGHCYATQAEALTQCGNNCTYCSPPCANSITSGLCSGGVTCGNACCPPEIPFYCAENAGSGFCFASNAEAYAYCGNTCVACAP